jgi:hypothetical protein
MGDEKCLTPRYHAHPHHHHRHSPLALQHGVLQRRRYVNIAFYFHRSSLLYYPMAGKSPRLEVVTGFYSNVGRITWEQESVNEHCASNGAVH